MKKIFNKLVKEKVGGYISENIEMALLVVVIIPLFVFWLIHKEEIATAVEVWLALFSR